VTCMKKAVAYTIFNGDCWKDLYGCETLSVIPREEIRGVCELSAEQNIWI
jgi:hypothetical protein